MQPEPRSPRFPTVRDAKRVLPREEHVENVGQRRPDAESGDHPIVSHPNDRENERDDEGPLSTG